MAGLIGEVEKRKGLQKAGDAGHDPADLSAGDETANVAVLVSEAGSPSDQEAAAAPTAVGLPDLNTLPEPLPGPVEKPEPMSETEWSGLVACESAVTEAMATALRSFVVIGRALDVVYTRGWWSGRAGSFGEYVQIQFGMSENYAHRFRRAWRIGARLEPAHPDVNEAQVRALLPVANVHGQDAAVFVFETVADQAGKAKKPVTAEVLKGAVAVLPDQWRKTSVVKYIREFLAGQREPERPTAPPEVAPVMPRLQTVVRRVKKAATAEDRHALAVDLREIADELERNPS